MIVSGRIEVYTMYDDHMFSFKALKEVYEDSIGVPVMYEGSTLPLGKVHHGDYDKLTLSIETELVNLLDNKKFRMSPGGRVCKCHEQNGIIIIDELDLKYITLMEIENE